MLLALMMEMVLGVPVAAADDAVADETLMLEPMVATVDYPRVINGNVN